MLAMVTQVNDVAHGPLVINLINYASHKESVVKQNLIGRGHVTLIQMSRSTPSEISFPPLSSVGCFL
jgi:hypothetical protein